VIATGWLATLDGHILTAGHAIERHKNSRVTVRFGAGPRIDARVLVSRFAKEPLNEDFAVLAIPESAVFCKPLPAVRATHVSGQFRLQGFGQTLVSLSTAQGQFEGLTNPDGAPLFRLKSSSASDRGYSGAAVYSDSLRAAVAIQVEAADGDPKDTVLAMPLYRIANALDYLRASWPTLPALVTERWHRWQSETADNIRDRCLQGHPTTFYSPLVQHFDELMLEKQWHLRVEELIQGAKARARGLRDRKDHASLSTLRPLESVEVHAKSYPQIRSQLQALPIREWLNAIESLDEQLRFELSHMVGKIHTKGMADTIKNQLDDLHALRKKLLGILQEATRPRFQRAMLVAGALGSGRTHLVTTLLSSNAKDRTLSRRVGKKTTAHETPDRRTFSILILPLFAHELRTNDSVENLILSRIGEITGLSFHDLQEFDSWLLEESETEIRFVVVVDDVEARQAENGSFLPEVVAAVQGNTLLRSLYWVFTLNEARLDEVFAFSDCWTEYGEPAHLAESSDSVLPTIDGWLRLDDFNERDGVGVELLKALAARFQGEEIRPSIPLQWNPERAVQRLLASPFVAWILFDMLVAEKIELSKVASLRLLEFVKEFERMRLEYILARARQIVGPGQDVLRTTHMLIAGIADFLSGENSPETLLELGLYDSGRFFAEAARRARLTAEDSTVIGLFRRLEEADLFACGLYEPNGCTGMAEVGLELRSEFFWQFNVARLLLKQRCVRTGEFEKTGEGLRRWYAAAKEGFRDGVIEFCLLLLDGLSSRGSKVRAFAESLWSEVFRHTELPRSAAFFALSRVSDRMQCSVFNEVHRVRVLQTGREVFAFVHCVSEASERAVDLVSRFRLLSRFYRDIEQHSCGGYFEYIVWRALRRTENNDEIVESMRWINGCEVLGRTEALAEIFLSALWANLARRSLALERLYDCVIRYLRLNSDIVSKRGRGEKWERYLFREFFIKAFCRKVFDKLGLEGFCFLRERGWFGHEEWSECRLKLEMEQQANIAVGRLYYTGGFGRRTKFVEFVNTVVGKDDEESRRLAFHVIRHSVPTYGVREVLVDRAFWPALDVIRRDPRMASLVGQYNSMFRMVKTSLADV